MVTLQPTSQEKEEEKLPLLLLDQQPPFCQM